MRLALAEVRISNDWSTCDSFSCRSPLALVMEGLTKVSIESNLPEPLPALAEEWKYLSPLVLEIKLRPGVLWSDGQPLLASHFVETWKRSLQNNHSRLREWFGAVVNATAFAEGKLPFSSVGLESPGPSRLLIRLSRPDPALVFALADAATWPMKEGENKTTKDRRASKEKAVLGPYLFPKFKDGEWVYSRNPHFYRMTSSPARFAVIQLREVSSPKRRLELLDEGSVDFIDSPPEVAPKTKPYVISLHSTPEVIALFFSSNRKQNPALSVRKTLQQALSPNEFVSLMRSSTPLQERLYPIANPAANEFVVFAPDKAKANADLQKLEAAPLLLGHTSFPLAAELAHHVRAQWGKTLGVKIDETQPTLAPNLLLSLYRWDPRLAYWGLEKEERLTTFLPKKALTPENQIQELLALENNLTIKETVVIPLLRHSLRSAHLSTLSGIKVHPLNYWDFSNVSKTH